MLCDSSSSQYLQKILSFGQKAVHHLLSQGDQKYKCSQCRLILFKQTEMLQNMPTQLKSQALLNQQEQRAIMGILYTSYSSTIKKSDFPSLFSDKNKQLQGNPPVQKHRPKNQHIKEEIQKAFGNPCLQTKKVTQEANVEYFKPNFESEEVPMQQTLQKSQHMKKGQQLQENMFVANSQNYMDRHSNKKVNFSFLSPSIHAQNMLYFAQGKKTQGVSAEYSYATKGLKSRLDNPFFRSCDVGKRSQNGKVINTRIALTVKHELNATGKIRNSQNQKMYSQPFQNPFVRRPANLSMNNRCSNF